jgi:asparagine synthase (glutamine-hydrolysing)
MCGFAGYIDLYNDERISQKILLRMTETLLHRGPDADGYFKRGNVGMGFRRLSIIDLAGGNQPLYNEDESIVLLCNGEIFNYKSLRSELMRKGHQFRTNSDVEVIIHLYEEYDIKLFNELNGQFAFALYDLRKRRLILTRDHLGINPLFYTIVDGMLIFASEIKAILAHPQVRREVDLLGLDQIFTFPGLVSPRTMFRKIESLKSGHYLTVENSEVHITEYWDLDYPQIGEMAYTLPEQYYIEHLRELLTQSVKYRLQADVPVGFYLSGGLDSSLIAATIRALLPEHELRSFSVTFTQEAISEARYQQLMAQQIGSVHTEISFNPESVIKRLAKAVYHSECPLKETYNTASLALSKEVKDQGVTVILTGEGADEFFAGYVGYRFDYMRAQQEKRFDLETVLEDEYREKLWGNRDLFYEKDYVAFAETKAALFSPAVNAALRELDSDFDLINKERLRGRELIHQRSYLDCKLRLSDHLISDHGDRMALAHAVEARYPFLDKDFVEFVRKMPPHLKLNRLSEKYALKKVAETLVPPDIMSREKFAFVAFSSADLLAQNDTWINDMLSCERIKRAGYFNPHTVELLKEQYNRKGFQLRIPFESDLLITVLTFHIFLELFNLPCLG